MNILQERNELSVFETTQTNSDDVRKPLSALYHDIIAILYENTPIKIDIMSSERIESRLHYYLTTKIYVFTVYRRFPLRNLPSIYHIITLLLTLNVYTTQGKSISLVRRFNQTNFLVLPCSIV